MPKSSSDTSQPATTRWAALPAIKSSLPILQIKLWLVLGLLLAAAVSGLFALFAWVWFTPEIDLQAGEPVAKTYATSIAEDFLEGRATPLPRASGLGAPLAQQPVLNEEGEQVEAPPTLAWRNLVWASFSTHQISYDGGAYRYERHRFSVLVDGAPYELVIAMSLVTDPPMLAARPTLSPDPQPEVDGLPITWVELPRGSMPDGGPDRIAEWATAYVANDVQALKRIAGDTRPSATYLGLDGTWRLNGDVEIVANVDRGERRWIRVRVPLVRANGFVVTNEYDLLLGDLESDPPAVQDWGPAGSAPFLQQFRNAQTP